jgi:deazaflavin-dependent oxidoreductase (nitroreductase family)
MRVALLVSNPSGLRVDRWMVRATGFSFMNQFYARAGGFRPRPCLLLTTRHHRTGKPRTVVLPHTADGDGWLVVGSHGGRPADAIWAKNLRVHPDCEVRAGRRWVKAIAREAQGDERRRTWGIVTADGSYLGYEKLAAPRIIPVFVLRPQAKDARG